MSSCVCGQWNSVPLHRGLAISMECLKCCPYNAYQWGRFKHISYDKMQCSDWWQDDFHLLLCMSIFSQFYNGYLQGMCACTYTYVYTATHTYVYVHVNKFCFIYISTYFSMCVCVLIESMRYKPKIALFSSYSVKSFFPPMLTPKHIPQFLWLAHFT